MCTIQFLPFSSFLVLFFVCLMCGFLQFPKDKFLHQIRFLEWKKYIQTLAYTCKNSRYKRYGRYCKTNHIAAQTEKIHKYTHSSIVVFFSSGVWFVNAIDFVLEINSVRTVHMVVLHVLFTRTGKIYDSLILCGKWIFLAIKRILPTNSFR